jgi:hypothetical protein
MRVCLLQILIESKEKSCNKKNLPKRNRIVEYVDFFVFEKIKENLKNYRNLYLRKKYLNK